MILPWRQMVALLLLALCPAATHGADSGQLFLRTSTMLGSEIPKADSEKLSVAVVSLQLQSTPDLSMSFTNHGEPVEIQVNLPGNKHFLRLRALGPQ